MIGYSIFVPFLHRSVKRNVTAIRREEEGRDLEKKGRERWKSVA
jgi:hypothetical protein